MKLHFVFAFVLAVMPSILLGQLEDGKFDLPFENAYVEKLAKARKEFREDLASFIVAKATKVEILVLDEHAPDPDLTAGNFPDKFFWVEGHGVFFNIKKSRSWVGAELKPILAVIAKTVREANHDVVLDHSPEFGFRLYSNDKVFIQTSISLSTKNWFLSYPGFQVDNEWLSLDENEIAEIVKGLDK